MILNYIQYHSKDNIIKSIQKLSGQPKVLIITEDEDVGKVREVIRLGVDGFLTIQCRSEEMMNAIRLILQDKRYFCPLITERILAHEKKNEVLGPKLSKRELEILTLVAKGSTTNKIAKKLFISVHTVNSHRKNLLKKLGLRSPIELVTYAMDKGLV